MTQFPEVHLVKELDMCPVTIALITDHDCGLEGDVEPVTHQQVCKIFNENIDNLKKMLVTLIESIPADRANCDCMNTSKTSQLFFKNCRRQSVATDFYLRRKYWSLRFTKQY